MSKLLKDAVLFNIARGDSNQYMSYQSQYLMRKKLKLGFGIAYILQFDPTNEMAWRKYLFLNCTHTASSSIFIKSFSRKDIWRAND